ncbi:MAG TPA: NAD(P)H-hydrate dehydratase [Candidatus Paceibacterota bacterium]|nr:NAD(P)H-hydrate dehydratase [Candidatus Paceibacterota bacterium]
MDLKKIYLQRNRWSHKGQFGYVLIIAGSELYTGSPIFNSLAALRSGADLVTVITPYRTANVASAFLPDIISYPLNKNLSREHIPVIIRLSKKFNSLIIGGGLNRDKDTFNVVRELIKKIDLPMVIDAEAIRALNQHQQILKNKTAVMTPHKEEFRILTGETVADDIADRKIKVKKWAQKLHTVILLKGHADVISDGKKTVINKTGSPYMTKGGFGDTLAGVCGALLARNINPFQAAVAAAFINGKAGELAAQKYGESVLASDVFDFIPQVIKKFA